jgi:hypothetical protein
MLKNEKIKANPLKKSEKSHTIKFCKKKISTFQQMITKTILAVQKYKEMDIVGASDMNTCIQNLEVLYKDLHNLEIRINNPGKQDFEDCITTLQKINNELSALFRTTGTENIESLISVAMGSDFLKKLKTDETGIFEVISTYVHPISYKVMAWRDDKNKKKSKTLAKNRIVEDFMIVETSNSFDCFDLARTSKEFKKKVYGIK